MVAKCVLASTAESVTMAGVATSNACAETGSTGRAVATASTRAPAIPACTTVSVGGGNAAIQPPAVDAADGVENGNAAVADGDLTDVFALTDTEVTIVRSAPGRVHPIRALAAASARRLSAEKDTHVSRVLEYPCSPVCGDKHAFSPRLQTAVHQ